MTAAAAVALEATWQRLSRSHSHTPIYARAPQPTTRVDSFCKCQCLHICSSSSLMLIIYLDFLRQLAPNLLQTIYLFFPCKPNCVMLLCLRVHTIHTHTHTPIALRRPRCAPHSKWVSDVCSLASLSLPTFCRCWEHCDATIFPLCGQTAHMVQRQDSFLFSPLSSPSSLFPVFLMFN